MSDQELTPQNDTDGGYPDNEAEESAAAEAGGEEAEGQKRPASIFDEAETEDGADKPAAGPVTPESYGDFEIPQGMAVDTQVMDEFKQIAAAGRLPKQEAQKLLNLQVGMEKKREQAYYAMVEGWRDEVKEDPAYGGQRLKSTVADAQRVLKRFDKHGLKDELVRTGYGNHPKFVKFLADIGKALKDDDIVTGRQSGQGEGISLRDALWPDEVMPKKY